MSSREQFTQVLAAVSAALRHVGTIGIAACTALSCSGGDANGDGNGAGGASGGVGGTRDGTMTSSGGTSQGIGANGVGGNVSSSGGSSSSSGANGGAPSVGGTGASNGGTGASNGGASSLGGTGASNGGTSVGGTSASNGGASNAGASSGGASNGGASNGGASVGGAGASDRCDVAVAVAGTAPGVLAMSGDLGTHDPSVIEDSGVVYELHTGSLLPGKTSTDLAAWRAAPSAFSGSNPSWIASKVPGATDLWAPDLSFFSGVYHLYYAASSFGKNTSCIGHATRTSMASGAFADHGSVVCSSSSDDFNAIDPNIIVDTAGTPWLAFGSFWSGIKLVKLDANGVRADTMVHALASRNGGAIEAPYIVRRCGFYYLFVSFDKCCAGADSTYNVRVGRSADLLGPYMDKSGKAMMDGGGTLLVSGGNGFAAAGHNAVLFRGTRAYNVFHAYPNDGSNARLRVAELVWDADGWPISGGP